MEINLDKIATELYGKIQTRFTDIELGDEHGGVLSAEEDYPKARFFEFPYKEDGETLGTITIKLDSKKGLVVQIGGDLDQKAHPGAFKFIQSLGQFAKPRLINFKVVSLSKSNLDKRDYQAQAKRKEEPAMSPIMENKMYGTSKISYQDLGEARLVVKHSQPVNLDLAAGRTMHIEGIYIENAQGERFRYPAKHLNGARALAEHIKAGGNPYDSIGKYITGLSEELTQLRKFKGYVGRNDALSEAMGDITSKVMERIEQVKKEVQQLQRPAYYEQFAEAFTASDEQMIPEEIMSDWIDRLTVRTFNEDLRTAFPYIFKLVDESEIPVKELSADDILGEMDKSQRSHGRDGDINDDAGKKEFYGKSVTAKKATKDAGKILDKEMDKSHKKVKEAAKWRDPKYKDITYTQEPDGDDDDFYSYSEYEDNPRPIDAPSIKRRMGGVTGEYQGNNDQLDRRSSLRSWHHPGGASHPSSSEVTKGPRKGMLTRSHISHTKNQIRNALGQHKQPSLPEEVALETFIRTITTEEEGIGQAGENNVFSQNIEVRTQALEQLKQLLEPGLQAGPGGMNAIASLKGLIDSEALTDELKSLTGNDDAGVAVKLYLKNLADGEFSEPDYPEANTIAKEIVASGTLDLGGDEGDEGTGGANMDEPPAEAAPLAPPPEAAPPAEAPTGPGAAPVAVPPPAAGVTPMPPAPGEQPVPPPMAESKLRAKFIKAREAGATLETVIDFGHRAMTLGEAISECGMSPVECGYEASEPAGMEEGEEAGAQAILKSISGFWNKEKRNFTIGGTRAKTKVIKAFKDGEYPAATIEDVKQVIAMIDKLDPSESSNELGHIKHLAGVHGQEVDEQAVDFNTIVQQLQAMHNNPDQLGQQLQQHIGNQLQTAQGQMPNQNIQFPGGQLNPQDMMKQIMQKINFGK